jgi:histidine triad (HIT) family protein
VIIPRTHIASAAEITKDNSALVARVFEAAAVIAAQQGLSDGFRIVTNCGEKAGQTVGHLHFHLLAGRDMAWPPG